MNFLRPIRLVLACALGALSTSGIGAADSAPPLKVGEQLAGTAKKPVAGYRETKWEELVPPGWNPADAFKGLDLARMQDGDPRAMDALARMREAWSNAPVQPALNGAAIRIAGFVIPLERVRDEVKEFLLVPYFGACIHTPPPPANQIIYVVLDKPIKNVMTMDARWVSGTLKLVASDSPWGRSGYRMQAKSTEPYEFPKSK